MRKVREGVTALPSTREQGPACSFGTPQREMLTKWNESRASEDKRLCKVTPEERLQEEWLCFLERRWEASSPLTHKRRFLKGTGIKRAPGPVWEGPEETSPVHSKDI